MSSDKLCPVYRLKCPEYSLLITFLQDITGLPIELTDDLLFDNQSFCLGSATKCERCGKKPQSCYCEDKQFVFEKPDAIVKLSLAKESITAIDKHFGPKKLDGSPDWRYNSHQWGKSNHYVYILSCLRANGVRSEVYFGTSDSISINEFISNFNSLLWLLRNNEPFKTNYNTLVTMLFPLRQFQLNDAKFSAKLSEINSILTRLEAARSNLTEAEVIMVKEAKYKRETLMQDSSANIRKMHAHTCNMNICITDLKKLFKSLAHTYSEEDEPADPQAIIRLRDFLKDN